MESIAVTSDLLWEIWFAILLLAAGVLFLAGLRFGPQFFQRQEKRWLHSYTTRKLEPLEAEGRNRLVKVKDLDQAAQVRDAEKNEAPAIPVTKKTAGK